MASPIIAASRTRVGGRLSDFGMILQGYLDCLLQRQLFCRFASSGIRRKPPDRPPAPCEPHALLARESRGRWQLPSGRFGQRFAAAPEIPPNPQTNIEMNAINPKKRIALTTCRINRIIISGRIIRVASIASRLPYDDFSAAGLALATI